jgi:uncharacterized protein YceK
MMKKNIILTFLAGMLLSGCGTAITLSEFKPVELERSKYIPSKDEINNASLPKVIITDIDNNKFAVAEMANLGKSLSSNINQTLAQAKSVSIINRAEDRTLDEEIKASELSREIGSDVGQADYVISGEISNASYDYKFNEGYYYYVEERTDKKDKNGKYIYVKKRKYSPPYIKYTSCVSGNIKILTLPELGEVKSIGFDGCSSTSEEARSPRDAKRSNSSLVRDSGVNALSSTVYPLKNFFAKKGYIYEMKQDGSDLIVKTNLGTRYGAREGESVIIYAIEDHYNMLSNESKPSEIVIGEGKISNQISSEYSWIIVDELNEETTIKAGDFIKIRYANSYFW